MTPTVRPSSDVLPGVPATEDPWVSGHGGSLERTVQWSLLLRPPSPPRQVSRCRTPRWVPFRRVGPPQEDTQEVHGGSGRGGVTWGWRVGVEWSNVGDEGRGEVE